MIVISRAAAAAEDDLLVPVGFRFHPTDEELVTHYLKKKLKGIDSHVSNIIREIDILKFEPWDLPERSLLKSDDENWFFFSRPEYKKNKKNRTTREGFWKITGREHAIKARDNRTVIGRKRILTFYKGRVHNSKRTNWVMHEYYIPDDNPNAQRDFVLCRLKKNVKKSDENTDVATTCDEGEPSTHNAFDVENQPIHGMNILEEDTQQQENLDFFERTKDLRLASSCSNNDHNATFADNDSVSEFEECLRTFNTKPFHAGVLSLQMLYELQCGSSQSMRDTDIILHNQLSRQAASSVNVAPKPQTDRVQLKSGTSQGAGSRELFCTLQSPACIEQGVVLQSPFGDNDHYSVTNKNDISTSDFENEVTQQSPTYRNLEDFMHIDDSDFGNQTANNMVLEQPCTQPVENLYPLFPPPAQEYYSYILQSPIYTEMGSVPHVDVYENQWQSTYDDDEQVSNSNANFENPTTDGRISEEFPQPKENLRSILYASQLEDYPSQPLMNTEECQMRPCEIGIEGAAGMNWEDSFLHFPLKP